VISRTSGVSGIAMSAMVSVNSVAMIFLLDWSGNQFAG
jgi:hypothetical protein